MFGYAVNYCSYKERKLESAGQTFKKLESDKKTAIGPLISMI